MVSQSKRFTIKSWSESDRPREKLLHKGKSALSDAELLAIIIGSGNRSESAVELCKRLLKDKDHQLRLLSKMSVEELQDYKGIGEAKAISIVATLELGKRHGNADLPIFPKISSSYDGYKVMKSIIADLEHEEFWVLLLDNSNKVINKQQISKGGITSTTVDIRLIFKKALSCGAVALILAHNHPSGTLKPSRLDIKLTEKIKKATMLMDFKLLDHIIVTDKSYYSFADQQLL
ncbi:DNA repair protein RadC [Flavobacterium sp. CS20]|uniref:RadC family protein n=1 Tax=Flavobacterium sp. CS20 TaxID=2775246 RepID=UPI001B3A4739|nr:DNA repair protein RadC [Flavobacterium sp. CS20]QTY25881.1 DNA repair protein RadC [Flavobacterium sp. CS20]